MNEPGETPDSSGQLPHSDVESLLTAVAEQEQSAAPAKVFVAPAKEGPQSYDFRNPNLLSLLEMRKLRLHQGDFIQSLASRLSSHLRLEVSLTLTSLKTVASQRYAESWANPSHLTMFKLEPLRGVSVLEISPELGSVIVDRLMGGSGKAPEVLQEMSEIEKALLEQTAQLLLEEWCGHWTRIKALKPVILGYESNGRFIQAAPPETILLVLSLDAGVGEHTGRIQIGIPFLALEPLLRQLCQSVVQTAVAAEVAAAAAAAPKPMPAAPGKWNTSFDEVSVPLVAEWEGLEMTAREIVCLKVGDVVQMNPQSMQSVNVRLADMPKFQARPGSIAGHWAVELTQVIKP